jgi:SpoVK/Ycf46/Vps4 family AAA+-type ATPase
LEILKIGLNLKDDNGFNWKFIADRTDGYSPADLQNLFFTAQMASVHEKLESLNHVTSQAVIS